MAKYNWRNKRSSNRITYRLFGDDHVISVTSSPSLTAEILESTYEMVTMGPMTSSDIIISPQFFETLTAEVG